MTSRTKLNIDQFLKRMFNLSFQLYFSSFLFPSLFYSGFNEWDCRLIALWTNYLTAKGSSHSLSLHVTSIKPTPDEGLQWCTSCRTDRGSELLSSSCLFFPCNYYIICIVICFLIKDTLQIRKVFVEFYHHWKARWRVSLAIWTKRRDKI